MDRYPWRKLNKENEEVKTDYLVNSNNIWVISSEQVLWVSAMNLEPILKKVVDVITHHYPLLDIYRVALIK